jgi:hypothetical protein
MLAALGWRLIESERDRNIHMIPAVLLTYSILFAANTAIGRVCLGPDAAQTARYATLLIPGVTAFYLGLQLLSPAGIRRSVTCAFVFLTVPGCLFVNSGADWFAGGKRAWVACYLQSGNISACDKSTGFVIHPYPRQTHLQYKLDYLKAHRLSLYSSQ